MRTPAVVAMMALLTLSLATCAWSAMSKGEIVRPVEAPELGEGVIERAADAAHGQRVLVISTNAGGSSGRILQSAKAPEGWRAYPAAADPANPLLPALDRLATQAAAEFAHARRFDPATVRALQVFGVSVVALSDAGHVFLPDPGERDPNVGIAPEVPALRFRHANPVFLIPVEGRSGDSQDPVAFVRSLRCGDAQFQDDEYRMWGGAMTVDAATAAEFLFPWPAVGARVAVDGKPAQTRAATIPLLVVKMPAGRHRVEVEYGDPHTLHDAAVIAAAAGVVFSLIALWLGLRPKPAEPPAS